MTLQKVSRHQTLERYYLTKKKMEASKSYLLISLISFAQSGFSINIYILNDIYIYAILVL